MTSIANKTALVTGASRGMGRATALALAAAGARVIVHFGRNADEAKTVVDHIRAAGGRADAVSADLAAPDGAHTLAAQVRNLIGDRLDIFVSNAGISNATTFENMTVKDFDSLFAVNVRAPYFLVQQLLPILGNGSNIVFLSSWGTRSCWYPVGLCKHEGCHQHAGEVFCRGARPAGYPRQRHRARCDRYRHVKLHQDRGRPRGGDGHADAKADRPARRRGFGHRVSCFGRGPLDNRRNHRSRWRL
jgi:NAD(P)-dependent dehydrogenase (short-subunit alcohol dehydrogenase family)